MADKITPEIMSAWDFMARFPSDKIAREHIERMRWGDQPICYVGNNGSSPRRESL